MSAGTGPCVFCQHPQEERWPYMCRRFHSSAFPNCRAQAHDLYHYAHSVCASCRTAFKLPAGGMRGASYHNLAECPCPDVDFTDAQIAMRVLARQQ